MSDPLANAMSQFARLIDENAARIKAVEERLERADGGPRGVSLRDTFAAAALGELLRAVMFPLVPSLRDELAEEAFALSDAMLRERTKLRIPREESRS